LEARVQVAMTSEEKRKWRLEWILDSGASCHFCNDASKFVSLKKKKCNITISTAKKGEQLIAVGIGNR
jgi:hypothetical protein